MPELEHRHVHTEAMLSVEDALSRILSFVEPLETVAVPIAEAVGMVLGSDVTSDLNVPPLDNSAMDGYAVRAGDVAEASEGAPCTLRIIGTIAAGQMPSDPVTAGTAIRIMTGAPIPAGADSVVPFEETDEVERRTEGRPMDEVSVNMPAPLGAHIRAAGRDITRGQTVLTAGTVMRPAQIGLLASLGHPNASVHRRPIVAILATGDELAQPGEELPEGRIYDSNSPGLAAAVVEAGGVPKPIGFARDDLDSVNAKLDEGLDADLLITSAGVSKGDFDMVKDVLSERGEMEFWSVRMRPGKPLAFGLLSASGSVGKPETRSVSNKRTQGVTRSVPHLGLPGNPVSALVAFEQFGRPAIAKMLGRGPVPRPTVRAVLADPIRNADGRRVFARAVVTRRDDKYHASLTGDQSSNLLTSMAGANGLAICPEDVPGMGVGEEVEVLMLQWPPEIF
jgi:molybdopterin molybdotransferase